MKENRYDDLEFFEKYRQMPRSVDGLSAAGEWHAFRRMLPDLSNKRVLDLGCGFGWHCQYAISQGAQSIVGVDISERMLNQARKRSPTSPSITYLRLAIEDIEFPKDSFDVVISSLAFHYVESLREVYSKVHDCLLHDGDFIFSAEHPVFTSNDRQDWCYERQTRLHWPVDNYYHEGLRKTRFLQEDVIKYHRTLTSYLDGLLKVGFQLTGFVEPGPEENPSIDGQTIKDELRRPMFFIVSAKKKA